MPSKPFLLSNCLHIWICAAGIPMSIFSKYFVTYDISKLLYLGTSRTVVKTWRKITELLRPVARKECRVTFWTAVKDDTECKDY